MNDKTQCGSTSRVRAAGINIFFGYAGTLLTALLSFILRKIFILHLDETLLGVNGLYTGVLSLLSMADLGVGTAFQFALYKPVAEHHRETVKSYMANYARVYRVVALAVAVLGLLLTPFLPWIIKDPGGYSQRELTIYYFIFLFNTVSTYFVSYKYAVANAEQKNYIQTNVLTLTKFATVLCQIVVLLVTKNFLAYLLTDAVIQLLQKVVVNAYLNRRYPFLKEKNVEPLSEGERAGIWNRTKALLLLRIGDVLRLQTDALLISAFINVALVGMVDNYLLVVNTISNFVNIIFNSVISGFGNLIATENKEKQQRLFMVYRFFAAYAYGFSAIGFYVLLTPLISCIFGPEWILPALAVKLMILDYFFRGERVVLSNYKTAAGIFEQDRYRAMIQGIVNLIISVALVGPFGLVGIYIGTFASGILANFSMPVIIYHTCFDSSPRRFFAKSLQYTAVTALALLPCLWIRERLLPGAMTGAPVSFLSIILMALIVTAIYHLIFFLFFGRTDEMHYLTDLLRSRIKGRLER